MTQTYAHDYVHRESVGNPDACEGAKKAANTRMFGLYKEKKISAFQLNIIHDINDVRFIILAGNNYDKITSGKYPFLFALVQPRTENGTDIDGIMDELNFSRVEVSKESTKRLEAEVNTHLELLEAARRGDADAVRKLVGEGRYVQIKDNDQMTPLHVAVDGGHRDTAKVLLEAGADVNDKAGQGYTPIHLAMRNGDLDLLKILLAGGASLNVHTGDTGETPLHMAAKVGDQDAVRLLLERDVEVNPRDHDGHTPLQLATNNNATSIVKLLLDKGAGE